MKLEIPEFEDWKEEADFWDKVDTAPLMEEEEGEWLGPAWIQPAPGLCRRCGAQMNRHCTDVSVAHGRIMLHEVEFYVCPRCGTQTLPPERQEFVVWTEAAVETTARETVVS
jgi:hypothetical protein